MSIEKALAVACAAVALCSCSKAPVTCGDLPGQATTDLIAQHLKSGFTNTEVRSALDTAVKVPADFSTLVTIGTPVVETTSQAPDGNSANCIAHFEAKAAPEVEQSAARWKDKQSAVRPTLALAVRSRFGDGVGGDGYLQFAARKLVGAAKVLQEYADAGPSDAFVPPATFKGSVKYVLTRGEGAEHKYAVTADASAPKWAQALTIYALLDDFVAERTRAAERQQLYGAFDVVSVKKAEMCGEEALCVDADRGKRFIVNSAALDKNALERLSTAIKDGTDVCLTGVEKQDGQLLASGVEASCQ
ncbi:hypothetical protein J2W25_004638 [Variovorax boronicumulans]|uniref:Lipoprotein n=1 Tax=Variovorax boronicumulans TaxID=436515 RepID=A0AAW8E1U6_9BURK|nr:hypothetical protein [Variovorax boronicumulans]MDP9880309.1 hypothetical protein [Variovorax boronicumulans]MDP9925595.1 hypothetical protein [Variovorax boronicumulans]